MHCFGSAFFTSKVSLLRENSLHIMLVCANIVTLKETLPKNLKGGHHALSVCKVRRRPNGHRIGGSPKVRSHLENLGITLGAPITVVQNTPSGIIVNIRDSRVAISMEMANKIFVQ